MSAPVRREGRGRLSTIDTLPDEAEPDVVWAIEQLRERKMPQIAILEEFNARLADRGIKGVSKSAWSRYAVRKAIQFRRLDEVRRISDELVVSLGVDGPDQVTMAVAEMVKLAAFRMLEKFDGADSLDSKAVMELSRALSSAVSAQRQSAEHRRKLEERVNATVEEVAEKAETLAKEAGLSADRVAQMRRDVLGLRVQA